MKLKILQSGEEVLRDKARKLTAQEIRSDEVQTLIDHMIETLRGAPGVGIAAPQVGKSLRIIVVEDKKEYMKKVNKNLLREQNRKPISLKVIINPTLTIQLNENTEYFEGCLSIDGFRAIVPRADKVTVSGKDRRGEKVSYDAEGWFARILQHECDHLTGKLYIDSMHTKTFMSEKLYAKYHADKTGMELKDYCKVSY